MDSMAAQKDSDFCVKEEPRMAVEDLSSLYAHCFSPTLGIPRKLIFGPSYFDITRWNKKKQTLS